MPTKHIKIKKGLDINLVGAPKRIIQPLIESSLYAINPIEFNNIIPKLLVKKSEYIQRGSPIFISKENEKIIFCSPVSGIIKDIIRGEKRKILNIIIKSSNINSFIQHKIINLDKSNKEDIKKYFSQTGLFPFIQQRPYGIIANPNDTPKEIFISGINSSPLSPSIDFTLKFKTEQIQLALNALSKLTTGSVHVTIRNKNSVFFPLKNIELHYADGPHPIGNLSIQIEKIRPINKGEKIWTVKAENLLVIGEMLLKGVLNLERIIAISGSSVKDPCYQKSISGSQISVILKSKIIGNNNRIIDGDVLTGKKSSLNSFIGYNSNQITVIKEGNNYDFLGWQKIHLNKLSISRALMFSFLMPKKKYDLDTNINGEIRPFVLTEHLEKVFPHNIYPLELIKSALAKDIDKLEKLGIYEVVPEDFSLTEFIDVSKNNHQKIIQDAINLMIKEVEI